MTQRIERTKRYKSLFIDLDDTIWDTRNNSIAGIRALYNDFALNRYYATFEAYYEVYIYHNIRLWDMYHHGQITKQELIRQRIVLPLQGRGEIPTEREVMALHEGILERVSEQTGLVDGAIDLLEYLNGKRYRLFVLSNGFHEVQYKKINNSGLSGYFERIILSDDVGYNKPHPRIYHHAMACTNSKKEESVMIGDNFDTDITGARGVRMDQLFFDNGVEYNMTFTPTYTVSKLIHIKDIL